MTIRSVRLEPPTNLIALMVSYRRGLCRTLSGGAIDLTPSVYSAPRCDRSFLIAGGGTGQICELAAGALLPSVVVSVRDKPCALLDWCTHPRQSNNAYDFLRLGDARRDQGGAIDPTPARSVRRWRGGEPWSRVEVSSRPSSWDLIVWTSVCVGVVRIPVLIRCTQMST